MGNCICCISHICTEACSRHSDPAQVKESIQITCTYSKHHSAEVNVKESSSLRALIKRQQEEEEEQEEEDDLETEEEEEGTTDRSFTLGSSDAEEGSTGAMSSRTLYEQMNGFPPPLDLSSHHRHRRDKVDGHLEADLSLDFTAWISNCCHKQYVCNSNTIFTDKKHTEERKIGSTGDRMKLSISSRAPLRIFALTWNVNGKVTFFSLPNFLSAFYCDYGFHLLLLFLSDFYYLGSPSYLHLIFCLLAHAVASILDSSSLPSCLLISIAGFSLFNLAHLLPLLVSDYSCQRHYFSLQKPAILVRLLVLCLDLLSSYIRLHFSFSTFISFHMFFSVS